MRVDVGGIIALILFLLPAAAWAEDLPGSSSPKALLERFDKAKPGAERKIEEELRQVPAASAGPIRSYVRDRTRKGKKRFRALKALGLSREKMIKEVDALFQSDEDKYLGFHLAMEMGRLRHPPFKKKLAAAIEDPRWNPAVQLSAAWSLAVLGDDRGKDRALESVLKAESSRDFGMETLAILRAKDTIPELKHCETTETDYWRKNSCRLARLRIDISINPSSKIELLSESLTEDGFYEVVQWTVRRLIELGTPTSGRVLVKAAKRRGTPAQRFALKGLESGIESKKWTRDDLKAWFAQ